MVSDGNRDWDAELSSQFEGSSEGIRLTVDELLLLDWTMCSQSGLLLASTIDGLMGWREFRLAVWKAIASVDDRSPSMGVMIDVPDLEVLLAVLPTSFNWGGGDNCGLTLKVKVSQRMAGVWVDPQIQRDMDDEAARVEAEAERVRLEEAAELQREEERAAAAIAKAIEDATQKAAEELAAGQATDQALHAASGATDQPTLGQMAANQMIANAESDNDTDNGTDQAQDDPQG